MNDEADRATPLIELLQASTPAAMRERKQWLVWRFEPYKSERKPHKVPYYVNGCKRHETQGSDGDRARLATFVAAIERFQRGRFDGIGFAFLPGDGLIGIDLDRQIDHETGEMSERCRDIIAACTSYTEMSPSGRGVHVIVAGQSESFKDDDIGVEVFCGRQFFTCTGRRWPGTPDHVAPIDAQALAWLRTMVAEAGATRRTGASRMNGHDIPPHSLQRSAQDLRRRLEDALPHIAPDLGYHDWRSVGMGIKSALGDAGFVLWDLWSSAGQKYPGKAALERKWASFTGAGVTEATVFRFAIDAGWRPPRLSRRRETP